MNWRNRPMVGFDLESSGLAIETANIVTACVGIAGPTGWSPRNWLLQQPEPIPDEATAIHGITTEHANEHGVPPEVALPQIRDDLYKAWGHGMPVVGHHVGGYDFNLLNHCLVRHGFPQLEIRGVVLDTLVLDKRADPYRKGSRRLTAVAAHHGVILSESDAHGAEADALAACRIAWKIGAGWLDLQHLHDEQVVAYRQQRESLAHYFRTKKGDEETAAQIESDTHWPIRPWTDPQQELIA